MALDRDHPLQEYPRPQLKRKNWQNLNGRWQYTITEGTPDSVPETFPSGFSDNLPEIIVPFSPECALSGVGRQLLPHQTLWYTRRFTPEVLHECRLLLHFGAVDQCCVVYCNGAFAGNHEGGYLPFSFDITDLVRVGENTLAVAVTDDSNTGIHAWGKQSLKRGGIWYTAQSGIWQTVWTETVPRDYIRGITITPRYDESAVEITLDYRQSGDAPVEAIAEIYDGDTLAASASLLFANSEIGKTESAKNSISLPDFKPWSPDSPFLYTLRIRAGEDEIESYFGMRKFGIVNDVQGHPRLALNGKPLFQSGLLDQGYWSDGLYTAPSDEAMIWEISELKRLGFNMLRKHIKIEPLRWYYHCDRLGMLVWQDMVSGGGPYKPSVIATLPFVGVRLKDNRYRKFGRENEAGRLIFERDMKETMSLLRNVVSLEVWVPFNEGWGQFDSLRITQVLRELDPTRLIDHASGWHDQGGGDFYSRHIYFRPFRYKPDRRHNRVPVLSEFGGYSCPAPEHMVNLDKPYGYRKFKDAHRLSEAFENLYCKEILPAVKRGLAACIYTQVSDVEDEINGIFTYDREVVKLDTETMRRVNRALAIED
jgi:hypothetical protein